MKWIKKQKNDDKIEIYSYISNSSVKSSVQNFESGAPTNISNGLTATKFLVSTC